MKNRLCVVVLYFQRDEWPMRPAIYDHLYAFQTDERFEAFYYNLAIRQPPSHWDRIQPDAVIFHTTLLSIRWGGNEFFRKYTRGLKNLKSLSCIKIALPQDEFFNSKLLCEFFEEVGVNTVFSVSPPSEWKKIYPEKWSKNFSIQATLTGYLSEKRIAQIKKIRKNKERVVDICYRAFNAPAWLGKHGLLKSQIAHVFTEIAEKFNLKVDISLDPGATVLGSKWFDLLLRSKFTLGVEGGASVLDFDGEMTPRVKEFLNSHPSASYDDIEKMFFPKRDGELNLVAISPRHLEACLTHTGQILVEGEYNNILLPGRHYIPLKKDFSNVAEVVDSMRNDRLRLNMVERAYSEVVESGRVSYRGWTQRLFEEIRKTLPPPSYRVRRFSIAYNKIEERFSKLELFGRIKIYPKLRAILPQRIEQSIVHLIKFFLKSPDRI